MALSAALVAASLPALAGDLRGRQPLAVPTPNGRWRGPQLDDGALRFQRIVPGQKPAVIHVDPDFGTVRIAKGPPLSMPMAHRAEAVMGWISAHRAAFGLRDPSRELRLIGQIIGGGQSYFRFQRVHRGLDVVEGELTVSLDREGRVRQVTGHYPPSLDVAVTPALTAPQAHALARILAGQADRSDFVPPTQRVVISIGGTVPRLAWEATLGYARPNREPYYARVYVDAIDGAALASRMLVWTAGVPETCMGRDWQNTDQQLQCSRFPMQNDRRLLIDSATLLDTEIDTRNARNQTFSRLDELVTGAAAVAADDQGRFSEVNGVSAHFGIYQAYKYFSEVHGRPSWKQSGGRSLGQLNAFDWGQSYNNAFATVATLDGVETSLSVFGNGDGRFFTELTRCLDVAGHEFSHNLVAATTGLVYENQSGALNEHFADAFGTAMDKRYENDDDILGENCTPDGSGIRNMADPTLKDQPAHQMNYRESANNEAGDYGGVHVNSGIPNKAFHSFYTATDVPTAERVWYRALSQGGLMAQSQFLDFVSAIRGACADLMLSAATCASLDTALGSAGLHAEVGTGANCPANSRAMNGQCVCSMGYQPNAAGDACDPIPAANCPANAMQVGEFCYCNEGYVADAAGTGCVPENEGPCVTSSHRVGADCVCDEGYYGDPNVPEGACVAELANCSPYQRWDEVSSSCTCMDGFQPNAAGDDCEPSASGCGDETFYGRCLEDRYLVYCNESDPAAPVVVILDCVAHDQACGLDTASENGFDCLRWMMDR